MKFSIKVSSVNVIWSYLLKKSLIEHFILYAVITGTHQAFQFYMLSKFGMFPS